MSLHTETPNGLGTEGNSSVAPDPKLLELLKEQEKREKYNRLKFFDPYDWQKEFMAASATNRQKLAMCANRVGKSYTGAAELAYHVTGLYPEWWEGHRFTKPIKAWACGKTNDSTRDVVQSELLGDALDPDAFGTGAIPLHCIGDRVRKPGVPNALSAVLVKHHDENGKFDGWSRIGFMSYEMGQDKYMGQTLGWVWLDEEPPNEIFTQCVTRTATTGGFVSMTFTPEAGVTEIVSNFTNDLKPGQFIISATWEDVMLKLDEDGNVIHRGHLTREDTEQMLAVYSPHERDMRTKGIPIFGSGMVFPVHLEEEIAITPFEIPDHWPRICGLDFGWDHPTAAIWLAWDRDTDIQYIYDCYKQSKATAVIHADALMRRGNIITIWPKDGMQSDKGSGINLAEQYREAGVNMTTDFFRNKVTPTDGMGGSAKSGQFAIEPGIQEMYARFENGTLRVFSHLEPWFKEFRMYHRKDGKIVPMDDDLMSASRYASCSADRYATTQRYDSFRFEGELEYPSLGPGYKP